MRTVPFLTSALGAILMFTGVMAAHAAEGVFYDPSNAASPTGKTIGYELFRTIGCPGRELLGVPCPVPDEPVPPAAMDEPAAAPPAAAPLAAAAPAPQTLTLEGVNFDFDKSFIRQEDVAKLDEDVATLKEWGDVKVEVAGHTDSIGTDDYNIGLSLRRANAVRNYLISKGIAAENLTIKGYGESQPVADNQTAEGRFKNRRVELVPLKQ
jgi:outer membrane protein OmpA-like peptidoglycan-associated protein